jgi:hypothetical protein
MWILRLLKQTVVVKKQQINKLQLFLTSNLLSLNYEKYSI